MSNQTVSVPVHHPMPFTKHRYLTQCPPFFNLLNQFVCCVDTHTHRCTQICVKNYSFLHAFLLWHYNVVDICNGIAALVYHVGLADVFSSQ